MEEKFVDVVDSVTVGKVNVLLVLNIPSHSVIDPASGKVWVFININDEDLFATLSHELLHVLGLEEKDVVKVVSLVRKYVK